MEKQEMKKKAKTLEPILRIGKQGVTDNVIEEIKRHLKKKHLIKIKLLRSFTENNNKKSCADEISKKTVSEIIEMKGNTIVLFR